MSASSHTYSVGLDSFLSQYDPSHFKVSVPLLRTSYNTLLTYTKAVPKFDHSSTGYELNEQGRVWVGNLDVVVTMWRGLFRDDESRALFAPFLSCDLTESDHFFIGVWKDHSVLFPGGPTPPVFPVQGTLPPAVASTSLPGSVHSPPSTTPSARGRRTSARGTSARGGVSRTSGSRRRAENPPSSFSSWAAPVLPSHFDASGDFIPVAERLCAIQNEFLRYRGQDGYRCFNCRMSNADCLASSVVAERCDRCHRLGRVCLPGPPITPESLIQSLSSARASVPPDSLSFGGIPPSVSPVHLAFLSQFNLTLPAFYEMVRQHGPGSSSG